jgi:acetylglutamate kinase
MIPKVESALSAIDMGLKSVMIVNGKKGFFENGQWLGTQICRKEGILQ